MPRAIDLQVMELMLQHRVVTKRARPLADLRERFASRVGRPVALGVLRRAVFELVDRQLVVRTPKGWRTPPTLRQGDLFEAAGGAPCSGSS